MLNCLIVEDEPLATDVLVDYVKQVPFLHLKATCGDAILALDVLQREPIRGNLIPVEGYRAECGSFLTNSHGGGRWFDSSIAHETQTLASHSVVTRGGLVFYWPVASFGSTWVL